MIQGFETRELTDPIISKLVDSVKGTLHKKVKSVDQYEKTEWPTFKEFDTPIAVFGILRGTADLIAEAQQQGQDWYYFDHAYLCGNKHALSPIFKEKIYRLTKNWYHITETRRLRPKDFERIEKYKPHIKFKPWKVESIERDDYVLVCPPSDHVKKYFNKPNWLEDTIKELKEHTKRDIIVREKTEKKPLQEQIDGAHAVVSFQSTVCIDAVLNGVPSFCDKISMGAPVSFQDLSRIDDPLYSVERTHWIDCLLASQFTMSEIENGTAWEYVSNT